MRCQDYQEAISAFVDGEPAPITAAVLDEHVTGCSACRAYAEQIEALDRTVRIRAAEPVPDLSRAILAAAPNRARIWPRYVLLWLGLTQLVLAVPALAGSETGASTHLARELGSWDIALAVALLIVAWQPRRAAGLLPFALALTGATVLTAVLDVASGHALASNELIHVIDLLGVGALWVAARSPAGTKLRLRPSGLRPA